MKKPLDFHQYLEAYAAEKSQQIEALVAMSAAMRDVFKRYTRPTRMRALRKLLSERGQKELEMLAWTPTRSLNRFRTLWTAR